MLVAFFFSRKSGETRVVDGKTAYFSLFALILHGIIAWHERGDRGKGIYTSSTKVTGFYTCWGYQVVGFEMEQDGPSPLADKSGAD